MSRDAAVQAEVLCGPEGVRSSGSGLGVAVNVEVVPPHASQTERASRAALPSGAAFRSAPLLAILDTGHGRLAAIGHCQVVVAPHRAPNIRVIVQALWASSRHADSRRQRRKDRDAAAPDAADRDWRMVPEFDGLEALLIAWLRNNPHAIPQDKEGRATTIAKAIAELSRNEVRTVRLLRYDIERVIGANLRRVRTRDLESVLADVVELAVLASRARDEAAAAWREGLYSWRTHPAAYHAQRRLQDSALPRRPGARRARREPWFATLDAAVRQCRAMDHALGEETALLHHLLDAAAGVSVARDAQAQETFTLVATVGGVLIGIPALVIALYGATAVLPIRENLVVFLPMVAVGLVAGLLAAFLPGKERVGKAVRFAVTLLATVATIVLLAVAGSLVRPK